MSERTLVLVKPDGVAVLWSARSSPDQAEGIAAECALEMRVVSEETATSHYAEHVGKPFFPSLLEFITSGPLVAMVVEGDRANFPLSASLPVVPIDRQSARGPFGATSACRPS